MSEDRDAAMRLVTVLAAIDAENANDPRLEKVDNDVVPAELAYSRRMSAWVDRLWPEAPAEVRIAARGQHIARWTIPRETYSADRGGYLRWREALKRFHAEKVAGLMAEAGYDADAIHRVRNIILKKGLGADRGAQTVEDALCLVFLQTQFEAFRLRHDDEKNIDIVRKTWRKMSESARSEALALSMSPEARLLIEKALAASS